MTRIKKLCALVLAVMMVVTAGVISVNAAQSSDSDAVSADTTETGITIHVRMSDGTQPYVYLWNSLPTNSAMSKSYPGEKMTKGDKWYNYHVADVTKVNAIVTDANGKQYSSEKNLNLLQAQTGTVKTVNGQNTTLTSQIRLAALICVKKQFTSL